MLGAFNRSHTMQKDIFLSVGGTANQEQEEFVQALEERLRAEGLVPNTVGRNTFSADAPLKTVESLMEKCVGTVVVALERSYFPSGLEKRGGTNEKELFETRLATPWNQIEAAMSYCRGLPLLVIVDESLKREGLLEPGYDWYVQTVPLEITHLNTPEFNGVLASWKKKIEAIISEPSKPSETTIPEGEGLFQKNASLKERIENNLTVWFLGILLAGFLAGLGTYKGILEIAHLQVVTQGSEDKNASDRYWLKITNVSFDKAGGVVNGIRVHGHAGGNPIAYPIKTLWAQANSDRTSAPYPIHLQTEKGTLNFEVIAETEDGSIVGFHSISNFVEKFDVSQTPFTHVVRACSSVHEILITDGCVNIRLEIRKELF
jgi:hypothetical protein